MSTSARPLARLIQSEIKDVLSNEILFGALMKGGSVLIDLDPNISESVAAAGDGRHLTFSFS